MAENKKSNQADAYMESMKAYQKTYDFLLYLYPILSQFPKFEKFALQSQIKTAVFEMLKSVIRFRKTGPVHGTFRALHALIGGGNWNNGVHCGSRAVNCNNYPWNVNTNIGVRCVCDFTIL